MVEAADRPKLAWTTPTLRPIPLTDDVLRLFGLDNDKASERLPLNKANAR